MQLLQYKQFDLVGISQWQIKRRLSLTRLIFFILDIVFSKCHYTANDSGDNYKLVSSKRRTSLGHLWYFQNVQKTYLWRFKDAVLCLMGFETLLHCVAIITVYQIPTCSHKTFEDGISSTDNLIPSVRQY